MKIESRPRYIEGKPGDLRLLHHDLAVIAENEDDSKVLDLLGNPGSTFKGEVRLADGHAEHYLLIQPKHILGAGYERDVNAASERGEG